MSNSEDPRRQLPAVDALLRESRIAEFASQVSPEIVSAVTRSAIAAARRRISEEGTSVSAEAIVETVVAELRSLLTPPLRRVINATGVILHTGLGRAPLSDAAREAVLEACGYCNLEFDLPSGDRGDRQLHVERLLCVLTSAEAALVVNNNAAALYLALNVLAYRREVVVSRGQLIEIGGSFRLPDIMARAGVKLVEVGTTNRTRLDDYRKAITSRTALLLRAHPSNFRIVGFTEAVPLDGLVHLGREFNVPVLDDLGNGLLWEWSDLGLPREDNVQGDLAAGADLALISGDKVLGGPQAGIIVGRRELVDRLRKSPLARVLRPGKLTLAGLSATLIGLLHRASIPKHNPVWTMLTTSPIELKSRADKIVESLRPLAEWKVLMVCDSDAQAGSGTLPAISLPSVAVIAVPSKPALTEWATKLRTGAVPVVGTVRDDMLWLDLRTVHASEDADLVAEIRAALHRG